MKEQEQYVKHLEQHQVCNRGSTDSYSTRRNISIIHRSPKISNYGVFFHAQTTPFQAN